MGESFEKILDEYIDSETGLISQQAALLGYLETQMKEIDSKYPIKEEDAQAMSLSNNCFVKNLVLNNIKSYIVQKLSPYQNEGEEIRSSEAYQATIRILKVLEEKQAELTALLDVEQSKRYFLGVPIPKQAVWEELFIHFCSLLSTTLPSQKWLATSGHLLKQIGKKEYEARAIAWLNKALEKSVKHKDRWQYFDRESQSKELKLNPDRPEPWMIEIYTYERQNHMKARKGWVWQDTVNGQFYFYYTFAGRFLRGIILSSAFLGSQELYEAIEKFALANPGESSDAIFAFSQLPQKEAIDRLSRLQNQMKNRTVIGKIEKAINTLSQT